MSSDQSREALAEAVKALIRERDYLRRARDAQVVDYRNELEGLQCHIDGLKSKLDGMQSHIDDLEDRLARESAAHRQEAETLLHDLDGHRMQVADLERERDDWRERATRPPWARVIRTVRGLARIRRSKPDQD